MRERPRPGEPPLQENRLTLLRQKNVPESLLYQLLPFGMQQDYSNNYAGGIWRLQQLTKEGDSFRLLPKDYQELKRDLGQYTQTYTEYWRKRIADYNGRVERPEQLIGASRMIQLLVTEQPGAKELDNIALQVKSLIEADIDSGEFVVSYVRCAASAYGIIWRDPEKELETLASFGLQPEEPSD